MFRGRRRLLLVAPAVLTVPLLFAGSPGLAFAAVPAPTHLLPKHQTGSPAALMSGLAAAGGGEAAGELADRAHQYAEARSLPAAAVSAEALVQAQQQAAALPVLGGSWTEQTTAPYDAEPARFTDPIWSNKGAGFGVVGGRVTALAKQKGELYAGTAGGGVWASADTGRNWAPLSDDQPSLSTGAVMAASDGAVWIGTGEANTNADAYLGAGVYRLNADGQGKPVGKPVLVGGNALVSHQIYRIVQNDNQIYAATSQGLYRTWITGGGTWARVLTPTPPSPDPAVNSYINHITDVAVRPGTSGNEIVAVNGYRGGSADNGVFRSTDRGDTWSKVTPTGALDGSDIGRTTLAYASGGALYALMESPAFLKAGSTDGKGNSTVLKGFYVSKDGSAAGPWTLLADSAKLQASGSAVTTKTSPGYNVGIQAWYNQALAVDPADPKTVFVSLEEVFKTTDGGATFTTASPYWNYGLACGANCPPTTHPDQHALLVDGGSIVIGNDGGVYSRPLGRSGYGGWSDLNATLHNLQYYDASAAATPRGLTFWGGLQDNGTSVVKPGARSYEPAGGDGFHVIVDPANQNRAVGEYTNLIAYRTADGGRTFTQASPACAGQSPPRTDCDPQPRFEAPLARDPGNVNHWVAGGRYVWDTTKGWDTVCTTASCDWKPVFDLGSAAGATDVQTAGGVTYAAWVVSGNPGPTFARGIATNYGGTWHQLDVSGLPNRYINGVTVDPANGAHAYAVMNGYSRRWIPGGGQGVVFETGDGGTTWHDLSGNLPDAPGDTLVLTGRTLALATDIGVFVADTSRPTSWSRLGGNLPHASVNNLTLAPNGDLVAATHGRGIWTIGTR